MSLIPITQPALLTAPALQETRSWVERLVVGLNLCPYARAELVHERLGFVLEARSSEEAALETLREQLHYLYATEAQICETTLLVCPAAWEDFYTFHAFQSRVQMLLKKEKMRGVMQVLHFHPQFVFAGVEDNCPSHYSNRSPYPTLHLLRESSIARAAAAMPDAAKIYEHNVEQLRALGLAGIRALYTSAHTHAHPSV